MREKLIFFGRAVVACSVLCVQSPSALLFLSGHRETATGSTGEKTAGGRGKETGQKEKEKTGILMFFSFPQLMMMIHIQYLICASGT